MTTKQLSVFLENKTGRINEVTKILGRHGINMHAFSMAESTDFGILRLIVSDVEKAVQVLRNENFAVMLTDVIGITCANEAGSLSAILEQLADNQIFIEYMYAFAEGDKANVIVRPNDIDKCVQVLQNSPGRVITQF
ncbi:MAG: amino acid-binding protein [Bacteroidaceae bacterium]|nr:amino acid-binding protein [Bacteroidaceae bacterium]